MPTSIVALAATAIKCVLLEHQTGVLNKGHFRESDHEQPSMTTSIFLSTATCSCGISVVPLATLTASSSRTRRTSPKWYCSHKCLRTSATRRAPSRGTPDAPTVAPEVLTGNQAAAQPGDDGDEGGSDTEGLESRSGSDSEVNEEGNEHDYGDLDLVRTGWTKA
uniref:DUF6532 domain-containing protein n=1 Tax=Mycena chlorophos TaxID=658473 RepID=A0ABQ0LPA7_MYCCL|nr:predicted protein [Mycena chlorophos]